MGDRQANPWIATSQAPRNDKQEKRSNSPRSFNLTLTEPEEKSSKARIFCVDTEHGMKRKMKVLLEMMIIARFDPDLDFWQKGESISSILDFLEEFAERWNKEKETLVFVERCRFQELAATDAG